MTDTAPPLAAAADPVSLHEQITARLRDHIVEGGIAPGARIPERALCEAFGISRTPLREALKVLAAEGLVELLPNRGSRVRALTLQDLSELFDLAAGLEALAGRLACENVTEADVEAVEALHREMYGHYLRGDRAQYFRCNQQIHDYILRLAGNMALTLSYRGISGRLRPVRFAANAGDPGSRWAAAVREHELILDALRRRAGADLSDLLFQHLRNKRDAILEPAGRGV